MNTSKWKWFSAYLIISLLVACIIGSLVFACYNESIEGCKSSHGTWYSAIISIDAKNQTWLDIYGIFDHTIEDTGSKRTLKYENSRKVTLKLNPRRSIQANVSRECESSVVLCDGLQRKANLYLFLFLLLLIMYVLTIICTYYYFKVGRKKNISMQQSSSMVDSPLLDSMYASTGNTINGVNNINNNNKLDPTRCTTNKIIPRLIDSQRSVKQTF